MYKILLVLTLLFCGTTKITHAQVDLPRGSAEINFPLYSYGANERLRTNVNLTYTGGNGILVNELAPCVGLGWQLQAGGIVTRSKRGEPDDQVGGVKIGYHTVPTGRLYSSYANTAVPAAAGWIPLTQAKIDYYNGGPIVVDDREADVFNYSFNGRNGSFVVGADGSTKVLNNDNVKIETVVEDLSGTKILTRFSKFIVTDEFGIRYTFSEKVLDKIILYQTGGQKKFFLDPAPANLQTYVCSQQTQVTDYYAVNNWHLSEILDPLTNRKITFTYEDYDLNFTMDVQGIFVTSPLDDGQTQVTAQKLTQLYNGTMKRLLNINLPDNNQVVFTYFNSNRADLAGDKALQRIEILKNDFQTMGYLFDYQYFSLTNLRDFNYGFTPTEAANARLCLKAFRKYGMYRSPESPYEFTYNMGNSTWGVPARLTPTFDHYGYFNGNTFYAFDTDIHFYTNIQRMCNENSRAVNGNVNVTGAGILTKIKYPHGSTLTYEYEVNRAWDGFKEIYGAGVRVKQTKTSVGINASNDIVREYKYVLEDGKTSCWGYEAPQYTETVRNQMIIPVKGSFMAANTSYSIATSMAQNIIQFYWGSAASFSFSLATAVIAWLVADQFLADVKNVSLTLTNKMSLHPANQNPLPMLYSRVEVYEGSATDNLGKSVLEFTSDKDFAINFPVVTAAYAPKQRCVPWLYGLMKQKRVYNKNGELVSDVYNKYNVTINTAKDYQFVSTTYRPTQYVVTTTDNFLSNTNYVGFYSDKYYPITGNIQLTYATEKSYTGPDYQLTRTDYTYDLPYNNLTKTTSTNSLNETVEQRIYYPYNYSGTGVTKLMTDSHVFNTPISTELWLVKGGAEAQLISAEIADYRKIASGDIRVAKTYRFQNNAPLAKSVIGEFDPANLVRNTTYFKEDVSYTFNAGGKVSTEVASGRLYSYIYDDNNELIIAGCKNADINDISYGSFEPGAMGNWTVIPMGTTISPTGVEPAPTGNYALYMPEVQAILRSGLDSKKRYVLSYWIKDGALTINGATITNETAVVTRNGWTLRTLEISNTTAFSILGTGMLDELRFYPAGAVMSTNTYTKQSEISSTMNGQNMAIYYEYDDLGRLTNTYDANRNLTTHTDYQTRQ